MTGPYDDLLSLPRPVSARHPAMARGARAAQFAPFAALAGFGDVIEEEGRLTEARVEPGDDDKAAMNGCLLRLMARQADHPRVTVTRFVPDERKAGGACVTLTGSVARVDAVRRVLRLTDGTELPFDSLVCLEEEAP